MELPKYHETFIPILEILGTVASLHHRELRNRVRNEYYSNLPQELLDQQTST
jgi:restriction system protein